MQKFSNSRASPFPAHEPRFVIMILIDLHSGSWWAGLELYGHELESLLGGQLGQEPALTLGIFLLIDSQTLLGIGQSVSEDSVIQFGQFAGQRLQRGQSAFARGQAAVEAAQGLVHRLHQAARSSTEEAARTIALHFDAAL